MTDVLYLVHRLPYPPNKGDKIRSYHLLQHLLRRHRVHLGCFVDDAGDERYVADLRDRCSTVFVRRLRPPLARLRSLAGLLDGRPLSLPYYFDRPFADWVGSAIATAGIRSIVAFSSPMAQYVMGPGFEDFTRIMDFVDIDSDKWVQYSRQIKGPTRWLYSREGELLARYEADVARAFDAVTFVSEHETALFDELNPDTRGKHFAVANGVASGFFDPDLDYDPPFSPGARAIVFTGMMDYWPNVDAMCWFARELLPEIRVRMPDAELWVVGASPRKEVLELRALPGVNVTGRVDDVRPYLKHATVVVAPLRIARGVQNKVLEALAMDCTVVCTPEAAAGLDALSSAPLCLAHSGDEFVGAVVRALESDRVTEVRQRDYILQRYDWERNLARFDDLLDGGRRSPPENPALATA